MRNVTSVLLRERTDGSQRVTYMELFFDLVYVFAVTQLSHLLLTHLSWRGAGQTLLLLLAVWWAWIYTAWATNWFDPDRRPIRLVLIGSMLASLVMSVALPEAFTERGLWFAAAYVVMQMGRTVFVIYASRSVPGLQRNFQRILAWMVFSGVFWLAGGLVHGTAREILWLIALLIDYAAPAAGFYTPRMGRSITGDWAIAGDHLAERCHLFVIVALGESILVTGTTLGGHEFTASRMTAFVVAFLGSVALWWVYFDRAAESGSAIIARSDDPGRLGRSAYTYFHLPIVAGIIVSAVADELVIAHPGGQTRDAVIATVLGGPALFLAGHLLYKKAIFNRISIPRLAALAALGVLIPLGLVMSPLVLASAATLVVIGVAVWDSIGVGVRLGVNGAVHPS